MDKWCVLSPCGTSLLTNASSDDDRRLLNTYVNAASEQEIAPDDRTRLSERLAQVQQQLRAADPARAQVISAELNGIVSLYSEAQRQPWSSDRHYILATDTWLGDQTASLVTEWLNGWGVSAERYRQTGLRTDRLAEFQQSLGSLAVWVERLTADQRADDARVVFNLTGGFKSVQGFLQTLGMFFADEVVYVYERRDAPLLRIPRLPIRLTSDEHLRDNISLYRRLAIGEPVDPADAWRVADTLFVERFGDLRFSTWGREKWHSAQPIFYAECLWPSPSRLVKLTEEFRYEADAWAANQPERYAALNHRIDDLARFRRDPGAYPAECIPFMPLSSVGAGGVTHECLVAVGEHAAYILGYPYGDAIVLRHVQSAPAALHGKTGPA